MIGQVYQEMENIAVLPDTTTESCIFFVWPLDIVHVINESSPFYNMTAEDLARERFELLIVMEGTNETSNMTFQARWDTATSRGPGQHIITQDELPPVRDRVGPQVRADAALQEGQQQVRDQLLRIPLHLRGQLSVRWVTLSVTRDACAQVDTPRYSARHLDQLITRDRENQLKKTRTSLQQELQRLVRER